MSDLSTRYVSHVVLKGPDGDALTSAPEIVEVFRRNTALTIARGHFGEQIMINAQDRMQSTLEELREGRRAAATSIGTRVNRLA